MEKREITNFKGRSNFKKTCNGPFETAAAGASARLRKKGKTDADVDANVSNHGEINNVSSFSKELNVA